MAIWDVLPPEVRIMIWRYLLPRTHTREQLCDTHDDSLLEPPIFTPIKPELGRKAWRMLQSESAKSDGFLYATGHEVIWTRTDLNLLLVDKRTYNECIGVLYGENTFVVDVKFDSVMFRYHWWVVPSYVTPTRWHPFGTLLSDENRKKIKRLIIHIECPDEYTGMIKYNYGGRGLLTGIQTQVNRLAALLGKTTLTQLQVHLNDGDISRVREFLLGAKPENRKYELKSNMVLEPLKNHGLKAKKVQIKGVHIEYAESLKASLKL